MTKIRALVVDDEPIARERVLSLLQQEEDVEVVAECGDGPQAVSAIQHHTPDLVFLDVQMPGLDAFGVINAIGAERMPTVIFVTAYDEYALRAFEVHALDYLLKPFGRDRFRETLKHARSSLERRRAGDLGRRLLALVNDIKPEAPKLDRLVVKSGGRVFFLRTDDLDWIEAAGNYVRLHLGEEAHLFRETMTRMEARLDTRRFVRIHRSRIVNTERIKELQPWFNGEYVVVLRNGTRLPSQPRLSRQAAGTTGKGLLIVLQSQRGSLLKIRSASRSTLPDLGSLSFFVPSGLARCRCLESTAYTTKRRALCGIGVHVGDAAVQCRSDGRAGGRGRRVDERVEQRVRMNVADDQLAGSQHRNASAANAPQGEMRVEALHPDRAGRCWHQGQRRLHVVEHEEVDELLRRLPRARVLRRLFGGGVDAFDLDPLVAFALNGYGTSCGDEF